MTSRAKGGSKPRQGFASHVDLMCIEVTMLPLSSRYIFNEVHNSMTFPITKDSYIHQRSNQVDFTYETQIPNQVGLHILTQLPNQVDLHILTQLPNQVGLQI